MIFVCSNCSNVDVDDLISTFGEDKVEYNCLGQCGMSPDKTFGYVNDDFVIVDSHQAFKEAVKDKL